MSNFRTETDSMGAVEFQPTSCGGADAALARAFQHRHDLMPREMITAYAILKKAAALANHAGGGSTTSCTT